MTYTPDQLAAMPTRKLDAVLVELGIGGDSTTGNGMLAVVESTCDLFVLCYWELDRMCMAGTKCVTLHVGMKAYEVEAATLTRAVAIASVLAVQEARQEGKE